MTVPTIDEHVARLDAIVANLDAMLVMLRAYYHPNQASMIDRVTKDRASIAEAIKAMRFVQASTPADSVAMIDGERADLNAHVDTYLDRFKLPTAPVHGSVEVTTDKLLEWIRPGDPIHVDYQISGHETVRIHCRVEKLERR